MKWPCKDGELGDGELGTARQIHKPSYSAMFIPRCNRTLGASARLSRHEHIRPKLLKRGSVRTLGQHLHKLQ